jgi:uroporphyrinogen decarboxylase
MLRGISNLYMDMVTDPDFVKELQEFCLPKCIDMALELVKSGANVIYITNPIANADCISRDNYYAMVHPFTKKLFKAIKDTGVRLFFHPCGKWTDRYDLLVDEGADALHVDKVDINWLKENYGDKITIMGNVKTSTTMLLGTPEDVQKEALDCIKKGRKNGGFILSADCVIPRDTPPENLSALVEAARI